MILSKKIYFFIKFIVLISFTLTNLVASQNQTFNPTPYKYKQTKEIVEISNKIEKLILANLDIQNIIKTLKNDIENWQKKNIFIFILDKSGDNILTGNVSEKFLSNSAFSEFQDNQIDKWIENFDEEDDELILIPKTTYVKKITNANNQNFILAVGRSRLYLEKAFIEYNVENFSNLIETKGVLAFPTIREELKNNIDPQNSYFFIVDLSGNILLHSTCPAIENKNIINITDTLDNPVIKNMIGSALTNQNQNQTNSRWMTYYYPKTGRFDPSLKHIYSKLINLNDKKIILAYTTFFEDSIPIKSQIEEPNIQEIKNFAKNVEKILRAEGESGLLDVFELNAQDEKNTKSVFVIDSATATFLLFPQNPELEGESARRLKDLNGTSIWNNIQKKLKYNNNETWIHYISKYNQNKIPDWKSSYIIKTPSKYDQEFIIGTFPIHFQNQPEFIEESVNTALNLIKINKKQAFKIIEQEYNSFKFQDTHFFITKIDGTQILDSEYPYLKNKNILNMKNLNGDFIVQNYINALKNTDKTWYKFAWMNPRQTITQTKNVFLTKIKIDNEEYIVGAGYLN